MVRDVHLESVRDRTLTEFYNDGRLPLTLAVRPREIRPGENWDRIIALSPGDQPDASLVEEAMHEAAGRRTRLRLPDGLQIGYTAVNPRASTTRLHVTQFDDRGADLSDIAIIADRAAREPDIGHVLIRDFRYGKQSPFSQSPISEHQSEAAYVAETGLLTYEEHGHHRALPTFERILTELQEDGIEPTQFEGADYTLGLLLAAEAGQPVRSFLDAGAWSTHWKHAGELTARLAEARHIVKKQQKDWPVRDEAMIDHERLQQARRIFHDVADDEQKRDFHDERLSRLDNWRLNQAHAQGLRHSIKLPEKGHHGAGHAAHSDGHGEHHGKDERSPLVVMANAIMQLHPELRLSWGVAGDNRFFSPGYGEAFGSFRESFRQLKPVRAHTEMFYLRGIPRGWDRLFPTLYAAATEFAMR